MKRIVVLLDGTWNDERRSDVTNVAKLDARARHNVGTFIRPRSHDGTEQLVFYHTGVGTGGGLLERFLGGAIGLGLKEIVRDSYAFLAANFAAGDEIYIVGFSRGAYAARALAGLIGASGIQKQPDKDLFDVAWNHYRVKPRVRSGEQGAGSGMHEYLRAYQRAADAHVFHKDRWIKCVAVWDTVGSYGIPAGFGFASLGRYVALILLGFHDTQIGSHIDVGLHGVAIDERRRPFVPTFWTIAKGQQPRGHVEQTWFAGVHCSVGGGYSDAGLSDRALLWIIARLMALTKLELDITAIRSGTKPKIDGDIPNSSAGWPISRMFPHLRAVLSPDAIRHGFLFNTRQPQEQHINEKVHWSVIEKLERKCNYLGDPNVPYAPPNVASPIPSDRIAGMTDEEVILTADLVLD